MLQGNFHLYIESSSVGYLILEYQQPKELSSFSFIYADINKPILLKISLIFNMLQPDIFDAPSFGEQTKQVCQFNQF